MFENTLDCSARDWPCFIKVCFCSSRAHVSQLPGSIYYIPQPWLTESNSPEIFDEYTRRQYVAKAPERNPYGTEEEPAKFTDFDAFTKVRHLSSYISSIFINNYCRFEFYSNLLNGPWSVQSVFVRGWKKPRTSSRPLG